MFPSPSIFCYEIYESDSKPAEAGQKHPSAPSSVYIIEEICILSQSREKEALTRGLAAVTSKPK